LRATKEFCVNVIGLSKKAHQFDYKLTDPFFDAYGKEVITGGKFDAAVVLDKRETFIEADFRISGHTNLICDRSLEPFDFPMEIKRRVIFKYGEVPQEISDEIVIITRDQESIDIGQYLYEFIVLEVPMKKIHPALVKEEDPEETVVYSTAADETEAPEEVDPRWEILKKLKK
jgi:uncharacterized protein